MYTYAIVIYNSTNGDNTYCHVHSTGEDLEKMKSEALELCENYGSKEKEILTNFEWLDIYNDHQATYAKNYEMIFAVVEIRSWRNPL